MRITLKLYATLARYLPPASERNCASVDVADGSTVAAALAGFALPAEQVHLVLVNGVYIEPEARRTAVLQEGDALAVWPPVAGG